MLWKRIEFYNIYILVLSYYLIILVIIFTLGLNFSSFMIGVILLARFNIGFFRSLNYMTIFGLFTNKVALRVFKLF